MISRECIPVFKISNVSLAGIQLLLSFLNILPKEEEAKDEEF